MPSKLVVVGGTPGGMCNGFKTLRGWIEWGANRFPFAELTIQDNVVTVDFGSCVRVLPLQTCVIELSENASLERFADPAYNV